MSDWSTHERGRWVAAPLARPERLVQPSPVVNVVRASNLFEDADFPADSSVLYTSGPHSNVRWKRPFEIVDNPVFIHRGIVHHDIDQGELGDCWFLASVSCLAASSHKDLLSRVVPEDQGFGEGYSGKFRFNFWYYGKWKEVVVDDRLPTYNGKLIYSSNVDQPNEFWGPLLEKAFAKLYGGYSVIDGGRIHTSLVDLTGGLGELVKLKLSISDKELSILLLNCFHMNSFLGGAIFATKPGERETKLDNGLLAGHAYTIINVKKVGNPEGETTVLHLRNPHGRGKWNGAWSDGSPEWKYLSRCDQAETTRGKDNGEFWMSVSDFRHNFDELELCHMTPDGLTDEIADNLDKSKWKMTEHNGSWVKDVSAGGPPISFMSDRFWTNPQIELRVECKTTIVISLFEVGNQVKRAETDISIGFCLFKFPEGQKLEHLDVEKFYRYNPRMVESSGVSWPYRERTLRFELEAGDYIIVPYTSRPGQTSDFYMRIFSMDHLTTSPLRTVVPTDTTPASSGSAANGVNLSSDLLALDKAFESVAGEKEAIGAEELVEVFSAGIEAADGIKKSLTVETCHCLMGSSKVQSSEGLVDKNGIHQIWGDVMTWRQAFLYVDKDKRQTVDATELQKLFEIIELRCPTSTVSACMKRYGGTSGRISEDAFLQCVSKVLHLKRLYLNLKRQGRINMDLNAWIQVGFAI